MEIDGNKMRKEAAGARLMVESAANQQEKDFWLGIVEGWTKLARDADERKNKKR